MSNASKTNAEQVATQLISALSDNALNAIAGGYDPITAQKMVEYMFASGQVKPDGVSEEAAMERLVRALEVITIVPPTPTA